MNNCEEVVLTVKQAKDARFYLKMLYPQLNSIGKDDVGCLMDELEIQIRKIDARKEKSNG